jgi:hypothetical protein
MKPTFQFPEWSFVWDGEASMLLLETRLHTSLP